MVTAQLMQGLYNKRKFTMFHKNSKWPVNIFLKSTKSSLKMFLKGMPNLSICSLRAENCYVKHTVSSPSKLLVLRNSKRTCQNLQPTERPEWLHGRSERPEASMVCSAITHSLTQLTCFGSIAKIFLWSKLHATALKRRKCSSAEEDAVSQHALGRRRFHTVCKCPDLKPSKRGICSLEQHLWCRQFYERSLDHEIV